MTLRRVRADDHLLGDIEVINLITVVDPQHGTHVLLTVEEYRERIRRGYVDGLCDRRDRPDQRAEYLWEASATKRRLDEEVEVDDIGVCYIPLEDAIKLLKKRDEEIARLTAQVERVREKCHGLRTAQSIRGRRENRHWVEGMRDAANMILRALDGGER